MKRSLKKSVALVGVAGTGFVGSALLMSTPAMAAGAGVAAVTTATQQASQAPSTFLSATAAHTSFLSATSAVLNANLAQLLAPAATATSGPSTGPSITLTSPTRGDFTTQGATVVSGSASDPSGIAMITINGTPTTVDSHGNFSETVALSTGLNVLEVQATSVQGVSNRVSLSVLSGTFQPKGQGITDGLAVRLNQGSLDAVSKVVTSKINGQMLTNAVMSHNPLASDSGWWGSSTISPQSASFGNPTISLSPEPGDLKVHVDVPAVSVHIKEVGSWNIPNVSGYATCDHAILDAQISISVNNGVVTTAVVNDSVTLQNFNWGINGIPGFLTSIFTGAVRNAITGEVSKLVKSALPPEVNKAIAGAEGTPLTQTILGSKATFSLSPASISIDANGLSAAVDADCSLTPVAGYTPISAPGSLVTGGGAPTHGGPGPDFFASVNEDLLNRAGFAVWQSGVAKIRIDDSPSSPFQMPVGYPLDMGLLLTFLPELASYGHQGDPLALTIEPFLPPVFKATTAPDTLEADLGEIKLAFTNTVNNDVVIAFAIHLRASAQLTLNAQNTFDVHMTERPVVSASLISSQASNINTIGIDNVISLFVPTIVQVAGNQWSGFPLPTYPGLTPAKTSIYQDGPQSSFVTAAADFNANGAALPTGQSNVLTTIAHQTIFSTASNQLLAGIAAQTTQTTKLTPTSAASTLVAASTLRSTVAHGVLNSVVNNNQAILSNMNNNAGIGEQITATTGYVALVEDGLEAAVTPLLDDYQARGVGVALVPLSHVSAQGHDRAEEIRNWLVAHCNDGVKRFLLLVGGPSKIPFRTCQPNASVTTVVTDLYYGDLKGNWDSNNNGVYGEVTDQPGFDAQMYVGRMPFDDAPSVTTAVNAALAARSKANKGAWSNRCLLVGATTIVHGDDPIGADTAKALAFDPNGWTTTTAFAPESFLKGDITLDSNTIVNQEQANPAALLLTFSHGSTQGLMSHPDAKTWNDVLTIPQLALLPKSTPAVEIAVACDTADPTNGPCIGSIALQNGLAAWVGCTVVTDPRSGAGGWLLATVQLSREIAAGTSLGQSVADTMRDFMATGLVGTAGNTDATADLEQQAMSWICYGDPGLCLGPNAK